MAQALWTVTVFDANWQRLAQHNAAVPYTGQDAADINAIKTATAAEFGLTYTGDPVPEPQSEEGRDYFSIAPKTVFNTEAVWILIDKRVTINR